VEIKSKSLILKDDSKRREIFFRDCCFLCENGFYAEGKGIDIDENILEIFNEARQNKNDVNNYAIFGLRKNGSADGLTGNYLEISGTIAEKLIETVTKKAKKSAIQNKSLKGDIQRRGKC
jgi:hypothetical protein